MTPLGKPLVFYLKYMAEMNRLYQDLEEGEERDLTGLNNPEQVLEMARTVGDAASEKVAGFLEMCQKGIENHFTGLGIETLTKKRNRGYIDNNWESAVRVQVTSVPGSGFWCAVSVTAPPEVRIPFGQDVCGVVIPYVYLTKGGRKGADAVWKILGDWTHSRAGEGLWGNSNTVDLACIPIKPQPPGSLDVDREPLVAEVMKTIARIGPEQTKAIAGLVAGVDEPDEN